MKQVAFVVAAVLLVAGAALAEEGHGHQAKAKQEVVIPYTLKKCLVSGEELGDMGEPYTIVVKQEIMFCCKSCAKSFQKDPLKYLAKLAAEEEKEMSGQGNKHAEAPKDGGGHDHGGHH
jgi:hypothetical protein